MSYILEALKKSQQERELGEIPTLVTEDPPESLPGAGIPGSSIRLFWYLPVAAALLGGLYLLTGYDLPSSDRSAPLIPEEAGIDRSTEADSENASLISTGGSDIAAGFAPETSRRPQIEADSAATHTIESQAVTVTKSAEPDSVAKSSRPATPAKPQLQQPVYPNNSRETSGKQLADTATIASMRQELLDIRRQLQAEHRETNATQPATVPATEVKTGQPVGSAHKGLGDKPPSGRIEPDMPGSEQSLPADIRRRLPARKISVLAYSEEPGRRFIILNSNKMLEGERSGDGLILESIMEEGVIFRFEQHRFFSSMYR